MNKLQIIYQQLLSNYGKQGWWPVTEEGKIYPEYHPNNYTHPKTDTQVLEIIFGAILTQNTSWKNVEKAIANLNEHHLVNIHNILDINQEELAEIIRSSGYHNQKAKKLKNVCLFLCQHPIEELSAKNIHELRALLLSVNGIGPETADSMLLYAFKKPIFVIDAYTKRIFSRIGVCRTDINYQALQDMFHKEFDTINKTNTTEKAALFNEYHALLVEHAKKYCRTKPDCDNCILNKNCNKLIA